jgi:hypothetical protein
VCISLSKVYKTFVLLFLVLSLFGCTNSNTSSDVKSESKQVGSILIDYMQNGKDISDSDQRVISSFISNYGEKMTSFNDDEKSLIEKVLEMNSMVSDYNLYQKQSDKQKAMDMFNSHASEYQNILKKLG